MININFLKNKKNIQKILVMIQKRSPISKSDIAKYTNFTPATISYSISNLEKIGLVHEIGQGKSVGGRRPILLELNPNAFYLIGLDLGIDKIIGVITNLHGKIIYKIKTSIDSNSGNEYIIQKMIETTKSLFNNIQRDLRTDIFGIGLSLPGLIDLKKGLSIFAPNLPNWKNVPIVEIFKKTFNLPVIIENDTRAMALAEARYGAGKNFKNIFCVNLGYGIGSGIIINGELYRGTHYTAGEFGHITILPSGPLCRCGNTGCLEAIAGGHAIAASAVRVLSSGPNSKIKDLVNGDLSKVTAKTITDAAKLGDSIALKIIDEIANYIGIGIASAVNLLAPDIVVIGGGFSMAGNLLIDRIKETVKKRAFTTLINFPLIKTTILKEDASSIGAATLMLEEILRGNI